MKIAKDIEIIGVYNQPSGGAAFVSREFIYKLATHPKMIEAYSRADKSTLGTGYTICVAEPDGSVTVLGDEVQV